jgi:thiamine biosynthesis lipoprotein
MSARTTNTNQVVDLNIPHLCRFAHAAMATTFEILVVHSDTGYAQQAACAAFEELDRMEQELSRFIENSDISRINQMAARQTVRIGEPAFECLEIALKMFADTNGAFDISVGTGLPKLKLNRERFSVRSMKEGVVLDLGGIGKGFAVDRVAELLLEWDLPIALIHGGQSSVHALDPPPGMEGWPISLSVPGPKHKTLARASIRRQALSGSGLQKGAHIIDPPTRQPVGNQRAVWICLPADAASIPEAPQSDSLAGGMLTFPGAYAETLSTAFIIMPMEQIRVYCANHPELGALVVPLPAEQPMQESKNIIFSGNWARMSF